MFVMCWSCCSDIDDSLLLMVCFSRYCYYCCCSNYCFGGSCCCRCCRRPSMNCCGRCYQLARFASYHHHFPELSNHRLHVPSVVHRRCCCCDAMAIVVVAVAVVGIRLRGCLLKRRSPWLPSWKLGAWGGLASFFVLGCYSRRSLLLFDCSLVLVVYSFRRFVSVRVPSEGSSFPAPRTGSPSLLTDLSDGWSLTRDVQAKSREILWAITQKRMLWRAKGGKKQTITPTFCLYAFRSVSSANSNCSS